MKRIKRNGIEGIWVFLKKAIIFEWKSVKEITEYKIAADIIVVNRASENLADVEVKVFSCDVFSNGELCCWFIWRGRQR